MLLHHGQQALELNLNPKEKLAVSAKLNGKVIWRGIDRDWKPWKMAVADVDGDHNDDFIVALYKHTRHSKNRLHTIYVYGFDGAAVYPKWRGSRLSRDFVAFVTTRDKKGDKLLTLERLLDGRFTLSCYAWSGFGFRKDWERGSWKEARIKQDGPGGVSVVTESGLVRFKP